MRRFVVASLVFAFLSGCAAMRDGTKVMDTNNIPVTVYATTECTKPNSDGVRCNVKTCKADAASDCGKFATACMDSGHYYAGTNDGGTCTRVL